MHLLQRKEQDGLPFVMTERSRNQLDETAAVIAPGQILRGQP
jgi:hypothetical protein